MASLFEGIAQGLVQGQALKQQQEQKDLQKKLIDLQAKQAQIKLDLAEDRQAALGRLEQEPNVGTPGMAFEGQIAPPSLEAGQPAPPPQSITERLAGLSLQDMLALDINPADIAGIQQRAQGQQIAQRFIDRQGGGQPQLGAQPGTGQPGGPQQLGAQPPSLGGAQGGLPQFTPQGFSITADGSLKIDFEAPNIRHRDAGDRLVAVDDQGNRFPERDIPKADIVPVQTNVNGNPATIFVNKNALASGEVERSASDAASIPEPTRPPTVPGQVGPSFEQQQDISLTESGQISLLEGAQADMTDAMDMLFERDEKGNPSDPKAGWKWILATWNVPGQKGELFKSYVESAIRAKVLSQSGVSARQDEVDLMVENFLPPTGMFQAWLADPNIAKNKMLRLQEFVEGTLDLTTLPQSIRDRAKARQQKSREGLPSEPRSLQETGRTIIFDAFGNRVEEQ